MANWSLLLLCRLPSLLPSLYDPISMSQRCRNPNIPFRFVSPTSTSLTPGILIISLGRPSTTQTRKSHTTPWSRSLTPIYWPLCSHTSTRSPRTDQKRFERSTEALPPHSSTSFFLWDHRASQDPSILCGLQFLFRLVLAAVLPSLSA